MSESLYSIVKIDDHLLNKEKILFKISQLDHKLTSPIKSVISNTDWKLKRDNWFPFSFSERDVSTITKKLLEKGGELNEGRLLVQDSWFNQYYAKSGSQHPFHIHEMIDFIGIYFVELEDTSLTTILIDPITKKEVRPRVNEGDMLICSGDIFHRSPSNYTDSRKTVVSFNFQFK